MAWQKMGVKSGMAGAPYMLIYTVMVVAMETLAKDLTDRIHILQLLWARFFIHFLIFLPFLIVLHRRLLWPNRIVAQSARSLLFLGAAYLLFLSLETNSLDVNETVTRTIPLFVVLLSALFLREKISGALWLSIGIGFVGVMVVIRPSLDMSLTTLYPLAAAISGAIFFVMTRVIAAHDHPITTFFHTPLVPVVVLSALILQPGVWSWLDLETWLLLAGIGLTSGFSHLALIVAYRKSEASAMAPFVYVTLIWATIFGWLFFDAIPDGWTAFGGALIVLSGFLPLLFAMAELRTNATRA